jgi:hypothetical protein
LFATVLVSPEGVGDAAFRRALLPMTSLSKRCWWIPAAELASLCSTFFQPLAGLNRGAMSSWFASPIWPLLFVLGLSCQLDLYISASTALVFLDFVTWFHLQVPLFSPGYALF